MFGGPGDPRLPGQDNDQDILPVPDMETNLTTCEAPGEEGGQCNRIDDDCDGLVDEGLLDQCGGCGVEEEEGCDAIDNDCDGNVDEEIFVQCGTDVGPCETGTAACVNGIVGECLGALRGSAEVCDDIDNDCDGDVDENVTMACGTDLGACSLGRQTCVDGAFGDCDGQVPPPMSCATT